MKVWHNISIRVFCKEEDNEEEIINTIHKLIDLDFEKEKLEIKTERAGLFENKKMNIFSVLLKKSKHSRLFIDNLLDNFNQSQKDLLLNQMNSRLDENLHFFIRLDKDMLQKGKYVLTESGNCFHIRMSIAAYPHKKEIAKEILTNLIKNWLKFQKIWVF